MKFIYSKKSFSLISFFLLVQFFATSQTWTGTTNTDWNTATNWSPSGVPTSGSNVIIPGSVVSNNWPVFASNVTINGITMQTGSQLNVNGFTLTLNGVTTYINFTGATLNNSNVSTDIVININTGGGGYVTYFRSNTVNDAIFFNLTGTNQFFEGDVAPPNQFNGNATFNINDAMPVYISYASPSQYTGNLTINRTVAGSTNLFNAGATITSNFAYTNNAGGATGMGNTGVKTSIAGTVNIACNYPSPATFDMHRLINQTTGGIINVQNSGGFNVQKDTLKVTSLSITGYKGSFYASLYNNSIIGNVTTADDASYAGGYATFIRNNVITGNTSFSNNGTNVFYDADGANNANKYFGNVTYNGTGGPLYIAYGDSLLCTGNLTINRTAAGTTRAFNSGATITGNFTYTNNTAGETYFGNVAAKTNIGGMVNVTASYTTPNLFEMYRLINQTTGGNINVLNSQGFNVQKDTLKVTSLNITGYRGAAYAYLFNNSIIGNVTTADDASYVGGYATYIRNNVITGNTSFSNNGTNQFFDADGFNNANKYFGNVTYNGAGGPLYIAQGDSLLCTGNLVINRTAAGYTRAFNSGATITGNFTYTNNTAGETYFGSVSAKTNIGGMVNVTASYTTPNLFEMYRLINQTTGGSVNVQNSGGFNVQKDTLKVTSLSITGYRGGAYGYFFNNSITGNVTTADDVSYTGGYATFIRNNVITGNTSLSNNGTNVFYDADAAGYRNKYIGSVTYIRTGGSMTVAAGDTNEISQNLTLNSTAGITLGKIKLNGATDGIIDQLSTQPININELIIQKATANKITLNKQVTILIATTFSGGKINTSTGKEIIFNNGATANNAFDSSYVEGPAIKTGNQAFTFPLGMVNKYAPISITAPSATTDQFVAQYIFNNPSPTYDTSLHDVSLNHINGNEYWILNRLAGTSNVKVTLGWDSLRTGTIDNLPQLRVARWNGTTWTDEGNGGTTGNNVVGTVQTTNPVTNFSPFTLASSTINNPFILTLTWVGLFSTSWHTFTNWNVNKVPGLRNNVKLNNAAAPYQPKLFSNVTIGNLLMTAGKLDLSGLTLTCSGTATLQGDSLLAGNLIADNISDVKNMKMTGKITLQKNNLTSNNIWFGNNKVITDSLIIVWFGGNLNMENNVKDNILSTLKLKLNGPGTVTLATTDSLIVQNDLVIDNNGNAAIQFATPGTSIGGNLIGQNFTNNHSSFIINNVKATGTNANGPFQSGTGSIVNSIFNGNFSLRADSTVNYFIQNSFFTGLNNSFTAGFFNPLTNNVFGQANSGMTGITMNNKSAAAFTTNEGNNKFLGNVVLSANALSPATSTWNEAFSARDSASANFSLNTTDNSSFSLGTNANTFIGGNFSISNTGTGTVVQTPISQIIFNGIDTALYTAFGTPPTITNITINKTGGVKLNSPFAVQNSITFTRGIFKSDLTNVLSLAAGSSVTGAWDSSYVDGPVTKLGNTTFTFPVGQINKYAPISMTAPSVATDAFRALYSHTNPTASGYNRAQHDPTLYNVTSFEYWLLDRTNGTSNVKVTLSWDSARSGFITSMPDLRVARWNGSTWKDEGNGGTTGNNKMGTVQTLNAVTSFSPFTLASTNALNPLPVTLISFTARSNGTIVECNWQTSFEINTSNFTVERSLDGIHFSSLGSVPALGNTGRINNYAFNDYQPYKGYNYYRLKSVNVDGTVAYSSIIVINFVQRLTFTIFPNPASKQITINSDRRLTQIEIIDMKGVMVKTLGVNAYNKYDISDLKKGAYIIRAVADNKIITAKLVVE